MDADYGRRYRDLHARHWWWRAREAVVLGELRRLRPDGRWGRILDVGCGDGVFFEELSRLGEVEGVEPDEGLLSPPGERDPRIHAVPFDERFRPDRTYGLILMLDVLEHLDDPVAALAHVRSLLDDDGVLLVTVPAFVALWTRHDDLNQHRTRYRRRSLRPQMEAASLRVERMRYFFHWLLAPKLATRVLEAVRDGRPEIPRLPPEPLNRLLFLVCRAEHALARPLQLPLGTSLLAVARARSPG